MLYTNSNAVVIGKHQNAFDECNLQYCLPNNIAVARRLSGGGTVFHGEGNLNFCFIQNGSHTDKLIDFKRHLEPINLFLHSLGVPSEYSGRNDLLVHSRKVSGNAEHVYSKRKRVIHHGTLLYNANLTALKAAIEPKANVTFSSHAVKSVRSKVANITDFLDSELSYNEFEQKLHDFLIGYFNADVRSLLPNEIEHVERLVSEKFSTWDWNFGYSPGFEASLDVGQETKLMVAVRKGHITKANILNNGKGSDLPELVNQPYTVKTLNQTGITDFSKFF